MTDASTSTETFPSLPKRGVGVNRDGRNKFVAETLAVNI